MSTETCCLSWGPQMVIPVGSSSLSTKFCFLQQMGISVLTVKNYIPQRKRPGYAYSVKGQLLSIANPQTKAVDTNVLKVPVLSFILTL